MGVLNRENQAVQLTLVAVMLFGLATSDAYMRYVKPGMRPWLLSAGSVLAFLAITRAKEALRVGRVASTDTDHDDGHAHGGGNVSWLLVLPFLAAVFVAPAPLGSYSAARQTPWLPPPPADDIPSFPPLPPPVDGAHELTLIDFTDRALYDTTGRMAGRPIRLIGFAAPAPDPRHGTDFLLTRFVLSCCAADAAPIQVRITNLPGPEPRPDTWVAVDGTWSPDTDRTDDETPTLRGTALREVPPPAHPYGG